MKTIINDSKQLNKSIEGNYKAYISCMVKWVEEERQMVFAPKKKEQQAAAEMSPLFVVGWYPTQWT